MDRPLIMATTLTDTDTMQMDDPYVEDDLTFTDEQLRIYLAGHRSMFTVKEIAVLDELYEESKHDNIKNKVIIRWKTPLLNNH